MPNRDYHTFDLFSVPDRDYHTFLRLSEPNRDFRIFLCFSAKFGGHILQSLKNPWSTGARLLGKY